MFRSSISARALHDSPQAGHKPTQQQLSIVDFKRDASLLSSKLQWEPNSAEGLASSRNANAENKKQETSTVIMNQTRSTYSLYPRVFGM